MDRILKKTNPKLFDLAVEPIQKWIGRRIEWLDHIFGICEVLTEVKDNKKFTSANYYIGERKYFQVMPCEEIGNFCFFILRDPQQVSQRNRMLMKSPFSLIFWYNMEKVGLDLDERQRENIKADILGVLYNMRSPNFIVGKVYEKPENVFADFSYDHTNNQFLMAPYAGLRIDGEIIAKIPCKEDPLFLHGSFDNSYDVSFDK